MPIYGDSYGNLQANITADSALRQRGLEFALSNAVGALSHMRDRQIQQDQFTRGLQARSDELQQTLAAHKPLADAQIKYYDWLMKQDSPTKTRDRDLDEKFLMHLGEQGELDDEADAAKLAPNASPTARNIAVRQSQAVRAVKEHDYQLSQVLADTMNRRQTLSDLLSGSVDPDNPTKLRKGLEKNPQILDWQGQLSKVDRTLKPFQDNKTLEHYVMPSLNQPGTYDPGVSMPSHLLKRRQQAAATAPATISGNDYISSVNDAPIARRQIRMSDLETPTAAPPPAPAPTGGTFYGRPVSQAAEPEDNPPAGPITTTGTSAPAPRSAADRQQWLLDRTKIEMSQGYDPQTAVTRARASWNALFQ